MTAKNCVNIAIPSRTCYTKVDILAVTKHMRRLLQDSTGPNSTDDVKKHVASCVQWQHVNEVKFHKETAPLHPVPVRPKVWHRVGVNCCTSGVYDFIALLFYR